MRQPVHREFAQRKKGSMARINYFLQMIHLPLIIVELLNTNVN